MTEKTKTRPGFAALNVFRAILFTIVNVIAAIQLDGWLSAALWVMAIYSTVVIGIVVWGWAILAAKHLDKNNGEV